MHSILMTVYVLVWPLLSGIVLFVITSGFIKEWREARREGRDLI
ncbi:putative transporter small subunit [Nocardioides sp. Root151]|nr:putative transporter small subunit [Nocardioides sp. Root151]